MQLSSYKRHKKMEKVAYDEWKSSVLSSNKKSTKGNERISLLISFIMHWCNQRKPSIADLSHISVFFLQHPASGPLKPVLTFWRKFLRHRSWRLYRRHVFISSFQVVWADPAEIHFRRKRYLEVHMGRNGLKNCIG